LKYIIFQDKTGTISTMLYGCGRLIAESTIHFSVGTCRVAGKG